MTVRPNQKARRFPALLLAAAAALAGCSSQGPTIDEAIFTPDPSLPAPKSSTPASPPPKPDPAKTPSTPTP